MTSKSGNRTIQGFSPAQERPALGDGRVAGADRSSGERRYQERMARTSSTPTQRQPHRQVPGSVDVTPAQWDDADWEQEAAGRRAHRLLAGSHSRYHRVGDKASFLRRWLIGERWVRRLAIVVMALMVIFAGCFGALWWRLGAGPINLDIATPWLAAAIEENIGHGNTVEVGGTQIERAGRIRIAVRIRDIIVRDHDHAIVASAPKAEVKLSGAALLMGRLRAESLNLVDAELAVRITPAHRTCPVLPEADRQNRHPKDVPHVERPGCNGPPLRPARHAVVVAKPNPLGQEMVDAVNEDHGKRSRDNPAVY